MPCAHPRTFSLACAFLLDEHHSPSLQKQSAIQTFIDATTRERTEEIEGTEEMKRLAESGDAKLITIDTDKGLGHDQQPRPRRRHVKWRTNK